MNFLVRDARESDRDSLYDLAGQFSLLNLQADKQRIAEKIELSRASFAGEIPAEDRSYMFVIEDLESNWLAGCSQIKAKHGTVDNPTYSYKIMKKELFSRDLGIGFIHQLLRLKVCVDGPTEIGGLVVDKSYRRRPEKIGRIISLIRFLYIGMQPDDFQGELIAEMAPPLAENGRSEFWEALGRRFTGMPYQEADAISTQNKEFIRSLFPKEDIYLCLLDAQARLVLGRVAQETQGALHLLKKIGFKYKGEVDPFDGGPHMTAKKGNVSVIKNGSWCEIVAGDSVPFNEISLVGIKNDGEFNGGATALARREGGAVALPAKTLDALKVKVGDKIFVSKLV